MFNVSQAAGAFAGVLTLGAVAMLSGAAATGHRSVDTIDVGRINVREPDGTLRLVVSSAARAPGIIVKGREQPHPDRASAGMIFFNAEGTETGGLIFDGRRDGSTVSSSGSLTFDRYEQDQVVQIVASETGNERRAGLAVNDQPDRPMDFAAIERARALTGAARSATFVRANAQITPRAFVGRDPSGQSQVVLRDARGVKRLVMAVGADGTSRILFLDGAGKVVRTIDPSTG